jgi:hypothetical protein
LASDPLGNAICLGEEPLNRDFLHPLVIHDPTG